jgi:hypothetical protein
LFQSENLGIEDDLEGGIPDDKIMIRQGIQQKFNIFANQGFGMGSSK